MDDQANILADELFIPMNIKNGKLKANPNYYLQARKLVLAFASFFALFFFNFFCCYYLQSFWLNFFIVLASLVLYIALFVVLVFELLDVFKDIEENDFKKETKLSFFNEVRKISENDKQEAILHYLTDKQEDKKAVILTYQFQVLTEFDEQASNFLIETSFLPFYRELSKYGLVFNHLNLLVENEIPKSITELKERINSLSDDDPLKKIANLQLEMKIAAFQSAEASYRNYLIIQTNNKKSSKQLDLLVNNAIEKYLKTNPYLYQVHLLKQREVFKLIKNYYQIDDIDPENDFIKQNENLDIAKYIQIKLLLDKDGNKYSLDSFTSAMEQHFFLAKKKKAGLNLKKQAMLLAKEEKESKNPNYTNFQKRTSKSLNLGEAKRRLKK